MCQPTVDNGGLFLIAPSRNTHFQRSKKTSSQRAQFYGRSKQCGCPVGARCSMGLGWYPLMNSLIQHTFKINFLFVEIFPILHFDLTKLFPVDQKSTCCFRKKKKKKYENKKSQLDFQLGTPRQARQAKNQVAIEKSLM